MHDEHCDNCGEPLEDITEHPLVTATNGYIDQMQAQIDNGSIAPQLALAILSADILATSYQAAKEGRPDIAAALAAHATQLAWMRRSEAVAAGTQVPDDISGLDG